jgi:hypothetical protein
MKRAPRTALEAKLVANLQTLLPILLGEPEQDDGKEYVFRDAVGKVAITYRLDDPATTGVFIRRHDNFGGAGFDLLELFDLTEDDVAKVLDQLELDKAPEPPVGNKEARSAPIFHEVLATARDDDGRIERYLAGRGLPGMAHHVRLVTMKGGRLGMAAIAVDTLTGNPLALQVLPLDSFGRPAAVGGKKVRRTYAAMRGWPRDAAFILPALEGGRAEVVMCEGTEDALSVRAVGWTGPIVATLGKGNIARHTPPGTTVILLFDGDVAQHEIDDAVEAHRRANRKVRIARLPADTDPNDMLQAGRGAELLALLTSAEAKESTVVEIEKALLTFPFDDKGHARYMAERRDLAKRFKLKADYLDQMRKRLAEAANPELGDRAGVEIIRDIEPATYPVEGEELFRKIVAELTSLVVFDKDDTDMPSGAIASALWIMSTHYYEPFPPQGEPDDPFDHATRLMISAGTIRSGKTRVLETAACLCRRVLRASNLSSAVMFRACERFRPTIMLDEVDQARLHDEANALVQLINDGFEPGGAAWRVGGEKNERLDRFRVFTPVALCGIGRLPAATEDRCLRIVLVRKPKGRKTARLNKAKKKHLRDLAPEILRWTRDSLKVLMQNREPDFPADIENDRDEDLWRPLLAIADTIGGEVPALARAAMLKLIAIGHEPTVGEELMSAIHDILTKEQIDRPDVTKIALQRLVGLVNAVDGPWTEYRGNLGCDSRWLSKQLKSFDLRWRNVRDPEHRPLPVSGYDILELLKVSGRYKVKEKEEQKELGDEKVVRPSPEKGPTSPTSTTEDSNPLEKREESGSKNVGPGSPVGRDGPTTANGAADEGDDDLSIPDFLRRSKHSVNPLTGKPRQGSVVGRARPTTGFRPTKSISGGDGKDPDKSNTYRNDVEDVADVGDVGRFSGRGSNTFYSDPIRGIDEPLPIDLTQFDPADLLPGEMKFYGYTVGPAPTFKVILPSDMPDDDPAAYAKACRLADEHRLAVWRRLQKRDGG